MGNSQTRPASVYSQGIFVNLETFLGTWYEIAKIPYPFQTIEGTNVRVDYYVHSLEPQRGMIGMTIEETLPNNQLVTKEGLVLMVNPDGNYFRIQFNNRSVYDQIVLDYNEQLGYAVIGSSCKGMLWFLSRTPNPDIHVYDRMIKVAIENGYIPYTLKVTYQDLQA